MPVIGYGIWQYESANFKKTHELAQTVSTPDGNYSVTVPAAWSTKPNLNPEAMIAVGHHGADMYTILLAEQKETLGRQLSLERFSALTRRQFAKGLESPSMKHLASFEIGDDRVIEYEVRGGNDRADVVALHASVDTGFSYVQIIAWTLEDQYPRNATTLQEVIRSFRGL